jgi:2,4-dienoyl-CoA reductase-like NADH-dependent reductase (Old Yellow Enzyme family)
MSQLFDPIKLRALEVKNRAWVSPMCQYSSRDGVVGDWHLMHIGALASGGAGLIVAEATGVVPEGRISIGCPGLYSDEQVAAWRRITDFAHSLDTKMAIQLAHAGRKGGTALPWDDHRMATEAEGGWEAVAPSAIAFEGYPVPRELSTGEIQELIFAWASAAKRAVAAGFDAVEIHAAHGYLLHEFYSPLSNTRSDQYGGIFENRIRFMLEVVEAVRGAIPDSMPLFVRISASDWVEGGWTIEESIILSDFLRAAGVDLIDVSSGGNVHNAGITVGPGYQVHFSEAIHNHIGEGSAASSASKSSSALSGAGGASGGSSSGMSERVATSTVGLITEAQQANEIIASGKADVVMLGRAFLRNPRWVLAAAKELGVDVKWPVQLERGKI